MKGRSIPYSQAELDWIKRNCDLSRDDLHILFVRTFDRPDVGLANIKSLCTRRGWKSGRTGQFHPDQTPHNKGKQMPYHPNSAATRFQSGQMPHTYRGPGHERVDSKDGYVVLIIDERNPWSGAATRPVLKHRYLWEKANGVLPAGHCLKCLDGDKRNTDPANWVAIPRALLPRLNGRFGRAFDAAPAELKPVILATAKLEHAAREMRRKRGAA